MAALATDLWANARRDLSAMLSFVEGAESRVVERAFLGLTGGPSADFNFALIDSCPSEAAVLEEFASRVRERGLTCAFELSGACSDRLSRKATSLGLSHVGMAPLMALEPAGPTRTGASDFEIARVTDIEGAERVADLVAAAFALERRWVGATFCSTALLEAPGLSYFLASKDGEPFSSVTTTVGGKTVGIWSMATDPHHSRVGAGKAVLLAAIDHHRRLGATTFYLIATPAGKPLYDRVGFRTVDEAHVWIAGQAPASH